MPANRTVASLSIALIVFVMLTFVLTITTYLFFKQRLDEQARAEVAEQATAKALGELNAAVDEKRKLQEILGAGEEKTVAQIEAETNQRFTADFVGFDAEPKTYLKLVDWLAEALRKKDGQMDAQRLDHEKVVADKEQAIAAEKSAAARAAADREKIAADAAAEKKKFDESRGQHEIQQQQLSGKRDEALNQSVAFDKLRAEVAKGGQVLYPDEQRAFDAKKDDPEAQLGVLYSAIRARGQLIEKQHQYLATLRAGDEAVQAAVLEATPKDDRIEGFDGRVISVDPATRTALISCPSTRGIRPGLLMAVYDPADPRPQVGARKGLVEVIALEGPTVARARIRRDSVRNPILGGDGVATSLWRVGESPEVVIVGYVQLDNDAAPDADALRSIVERMGGSVLETVTPTTTIVVDAGNPKPIAGGDAKIPGWRPNVDEKRRETAIKAARQLGVRVVGLDEMLDLLGLERADLEAGRLPTRGDDGRSLPRRSAGVAY